MEQINFGILGPGRIAHRFAEAFTVVPEARVAAVASRDKDRGTTFARLHHVPRVCTSYEALIADPQVDVIYVATPHAFHCEHTLQCLNGGKPVICEKPLAINARQVRRMIEQARTAGVFFMEGMWSRFFPALQHVVDEVAKGTIGEVTHVKADFGFNAPVDHNNRVYASGLGGGAHLDVGVYPQFLALLLLGRPNAIMSGSELASTGVDATTRATFKYNRARADIFSSITDDSPKVSEIRGTDGIIEMTSPWYKTSETITRLNSGEVIRNTFPIRSTGFEYEIREVVHCLRTGKVESDLMPLSFSLLMAEVSDEIKRQGNIVYPADDPEYLQNLT